MELNLEATRKIMANASKHAEDEGFAPMAFVVIDAGGNMVAALRQDGATHWRISIADGKAQCALGMGTSSRAIAQVAEARPAFVQSLMAMTDGKVITSPGGVIIRNETGDALGAIGVSGDLPDRDEACAFTGIKAAGLHYIE
jgi:uncharacterized protein GlcG (DUF336 family)